MELKFKNITKSTQAIYNEFLKHHNQKYKKRDLLTMLLLILVILYMVTFNVVYGNYLIGIGIFIIAILCIVLNKDYQKKVVKREINSSKIKNEEEIEYCFYGKYYFTVKSSQNKQKVRYYKLYRINNDDRNFYLYIDRTHALIVSKLGFIKGTAKEFKTFIAKKCRFKYI